MGVECLGGRVVLSASIHGRDPQLLSEYRCLPLCLVNGKWKLPRQKKNDFLTLSFVIKKEKKNQI